MTSWLTKQRKGDLQQLASSAGISGFDEMLKDDLVSALDGELQTNASSYSNNPIFSGYYGRTGSPVKRERQPSSAPGGDDSKLQRRRKLTSKVREEIDTPGEESSPEVTTLASRTPRAVQRLAQHVPLPASPQVVTDMIVRGQADLGNKISSAWENSGAIELIDSVRETSSTVVGVQLAVLLLEAYSIQRYTFPWKHSIHIPPTYISSFAPRGIDVALPDVFNLLEMKFWAHSTLWLSTSVFIPLLFAYFFNFTTPATPVRRRNATGHYRVDPLTFNVVKALATWLVYAQGVTGGLASHSTVSFVNTAFPGGYQGVLVGAGVGALASLYDAILQKH